MKKFCLIILMNLIVCVTPVYADVIISDVPIETSELQESEPTPETPLVTISEVTENKSNAIIISAPSNGPTVSANQKSSLSNMIDVMGGPGVSMKNASTITNFASTDPMRLEMVSYAKQFLGNPYVYGGTSLTNGADCSGFTMRIYEHFGINTGRDSRSQAANCTKISRDQLQPGDLVFYASGDYINHVAMYIGNGEIIHASDSKTGIIIAKMDYRTPYLYGTFLKQG